MPVITARHRVLAFLAKQPRASAAQIGSALHMSAAAVRHHLSVLTADGRISMIGIRPPTGRGRPVKEYRLSEKSLGDNLAMLSDVLLSELASNVSPAATDGAMAVISGGLAERMGRMDSTLPATRRLTLVMEKLNEVHYQARWEAGREGPRILFAHCPYAAIIERHPVLCRMDAALLEEEFGIRAHQLSKIDQKAGEATHCIFILR